MEEKKEELNIKFNYNKLSTKRLQEFKPSTTLGEELKLQRNYYDITKYPKTTTTNKCNKLADFLNIVNNEDILKRLNNVKELEEYLKTKYIKTDFTGAGSPSRISELEKEKNSKLDMFNRDNYFTSYYCLFKMYGFLDFNSLLKLLHRYNVNYKYSSTKILELPKNYKAEFNVFQNNPWGFSFSSVIKPYLKNLKLEEGVELSLCIGEPSYFIKELLENKIVTITYDTAKKLLNSTGLKLANNHTIDELLYSFGMLNNKDVIKEREVDEYIAELEFEKHQEQNNLIPVNFNYIYDKNSVEDFTFLADLKEMIGQVNNNLLKFVNDSCSVYDVDSMLNAYKVLTTLKNMSKDMVESSKLLSLPLNENMNEIVKYYENTISKGYYARPFNITLLDDIEPSEDGKVESLNVCIPKLVVDVKKNANEYKFTNYFNEIYSEDMFKKDYEQPIK